MPSQLPSRVTIRRKPRITTCYLVSAHPGHKGVSDRLTGHHSVLWFNYSCQWDVNGLMVDISPGDCLVLPEGATVRCRGVSGRGDHIFVTFRAVPGSDGQRLVLPAHFSMGSRFDAYWKEAQAVVDEFIFGHRPGHKECAALLFERLLIHLSDDFKAGFFTASHTSRRADRVVREIANWVTLHQPPHLNVADLARHHGISPDHLNRRFRHIYGASLKRYFQEKRLQKCLTLIQSTSRPLKEIARMSGFCDSHHFNKAIRSRFHKSPTVLRRGGEAKV